MTLILASGSASRRAILQSAGIDFEVDPADLDEDALKAGFAGDLGDLALKLAEEKALAKRRPADELLAREVIHQPVPQVRDLA